MFNACVKKEPPMENKAYLKMNFNPIEHTDGMTPERLKNLKGEIQKLSVFEYAANEDLSKGAMTQGTATFTLVFDVNKRIIEEWGYRDTKQVASKTFYRDFKYRKRDDYLMFNREGEEALREEYKYNENGILVSESRQQSDEKKEWSFDLTYAGDTAIQKTKWGADKYLHDKLIESSQNNGSLVLSYEYDSDGNLKSITQKDKGAISYIEQFNPQGNLIFIQHHSYKKSNLVRKSTRTLKYDDKQRKSEEIEIIETNNGTSEMIRTYEYNMGRLAKVFENGELIGDYTYNDKGDLIEKIYLRDKETFQYTKYDSLGNWLKKIMFHNDKPFVITEREIEYQ